MQAHRGFGPKIEVNGETLLATVAVLREAGLPGQEILNRHGLDRVEPGQWFPQEHCFAAFREISTRMGDQTLFAIGHRIPDHARFPPGIDGPDRALRALGAAYQVNHRGGVIGVYRVRFLGPGQAEVECQNPYPSAFDHGLLQGLLDRYTAGSGRAKVHLDEDRPTRRSGGASCTFRLTW